MGINRGRIDGKGMKGRRIAMSIGKEKFANFNFSGSDDEGVSRGEQICLESEETQRQECEPIQVPTKGWGGKGGRLWGIEIDPKDVATFRELIGQSEKEMGYWQAVLYMALNT
jgi:hypothetical protein